MDKTPVLIVGGGPVGLALACELGWRGIACTLIEQSDGAIATPKMNEVNVRTMEFCRRWGIADDVHRCPFPPDYPLDVAFVTSLSGYEIGRMPRLPRSSEQPEPHSPMRLQVCSQMWFDPILQRFARMFPQVRLQYRTRLESFATSENGVSAEVVDLESGQRQHIEANYLVGCDGANSAVRRSLGIGLGGKTLGYPVHLYFRAPNLLEICGRKPTTFFVTVDRDGVWSNVRVIDPVNAIWRLMVLDAGSILDPERVDRETYLRRAVGRPLEVQWVGTSVWTQRSFRTICKRTRCSCRRRRSSTVSHRSARHEYRYRRRGRSRLETRSGPRWVGRHRPAIKLRDRTASNWFTKRWHDCGILPRSSKKGR